MDVTVGNEASKNVEHGRADEALKSVVCTKFQDTSTSGKTVALQISQFTTSAKKSLAAPTTMDPPFPPPRLAAIEPQQYRTGCSTRAAHA